MFRPTRNSSSLRIRWIWSSDPLHLFYIYIIHPIIYLFTEIKTKGAIHRAVCGSFCVMGRGKIEISNGWGLCVKSPVCGPARAESPISPEPGATPWVPLYHSLRPERAKVKANHSPILLPLQGVVVYALIPRALPWAENWLPFQGARGEGCGVCPLQGQRAPLYQSGF